MSKNSVTITNENKRVTIVPDLEYGNGTIYNISFYNQDTLIDSYYAWADDIIMMLFDFLNNIKYHGLSEN